VEQGASIVAKELDTRFRGAPPAAGTTEIAPSESKYASFVPSGDHAGRHPFVVATHTGLDPSTAATQRSDPRPYTICVRSGDRTNIQFPDDQLVNCVRLLPSPPTEITCDTRFGARSLLSTITPAYPALEPLPLAVAPPTTATSTSRTAYAKHVP
jgi:hypothetical protein